jgi:hypothetical protein
VTGIERFMNGESLEDLIRQLMASDEKERLEHFIQHHLAPSPTRPGGGLAGKERSSLSK